MRPTWLAAGLGLAVSVGGLVAMTRLATASPPDKAPAVVSGARKAVIGGYTVVWLSGTPYEMGQQHGTILHDDLKKALDAIYWNVPLRTLLFWAKSKGMLAVAQQNSYPEMQEEMAGFLAATKDLGWTMDEVMALNFGDMIVEYVRHGMPETEDLVPGCSQFVASGAATKDGRLYHGRLLDWTKIDYVLQNPVIFVRQPKGGLGHATIGFPGNISPYSGINEAGLSIASNEADPLNNDVHDRKGRSHVQMQMQILSTCRTLAEAKALIERENHMTCETITIADGKTREAMVFEMAPNHIGERPLQEGVVYATNHFVAPETAPWDKQPAGPGSLRRFERLGQLLAPGVGHSRYGQLDPQGMIDILRDHVDPWTGKSSPATEPDDNLSLATCGALYAILFDPEARSFWVAAGKEPVPMQPYVGFSLPALLSGSVSQASMPAPFD